MVFKKSQELKVQAKKQLSNCQCECAASFFIVAAIVAAAALAGWLVIKFLYTYGIIEYDAAEMVRHGTPRFYAVCAVAAVMLVIALIPLKYGICWYYAQAAEGRNVPASCFFSCYKHQNHFRKTLRLGITVWGYRLIGLIPMNAVIALCCAAWIRYSDGGKSAFAETVLFALMLLVITAAIFLYCVYSMSYELVPYIYAESTEKSVREIILFSRRCADGLRLYLIKTMFSFALWMLSCLLIFPMIYVVPYMSMTFAVAVNDAIASEKNNGGEDSAVCGEKESAIV